MKGSEHLYSPRCCPIGSQQSKQIDALPERGARYREEPRKAVAPVGQVRLETQQHVDQQCGKNLPAHGIGTMSQETGELQSLFDLLEEHFDVPAPTIQIARRGGAPGQVVGDEDQLP